MRFTFLVLCGSLVVPVLAPRPLRAQGIEQRVAAIRNGAVTFHFAARPGVCGDGEHFIRTGRHSYYGSFSSRDAGTELCIEGPVQVRLTIVDGSVTRVQSWVGPLRDRNARDIGVVPGGDAARYLMTLAQRGSAGASAKAIFPAVLTDSATVWPTLLAIARDSETRSKGTRREASLWLSRFASAVVAGHRNDPFADDDTDDPDEDLKSQAVFVLSQLPHDEGIQDLLEVARNNASPRVRGQAMFWLGQSGDPRAIALFESVLRS